MSLIVCPECRSEVSNVATACPKCGFPINAPIVHEEPTVVRRQPEIVVNEVVQTTRSSFPNWIFVPIALALVLVIFGFIYLAQSNSENDNRAQTNARIVESNSQTSTATTTQTTTTAAAPVTSVPTVPTTGSSSSITTTTLPPAGSVTSSQTVTTTEVPATGINGGVASVPVAPASDKGAVRINATITNQRGAKQPVRQEKFYLLKEDLDTILRRARIEPENGDYSSSMGVALIDPAKRANLQQYLAAIKPYIVYSTTTDGKGAAQFKDVKPDSYYVFGITRDGKSFAIWNTNVVVNAGDNSLALDGNATPVQVESVADSDY